MGVCQCLVGRCLEGRWYILDSFLLGLVTDLSINFTMDIIRLLCCPGFLKYYKLFSNLSCMVAWWPCEYSSYPYILLYLNGCTEYCYSYILLFFISEFLFFSLLHIFLHLYIPLWDSSLVMRRRILCEEYPFLQLVVLVLFWQ